MIILFRIEVVTTEEDHCQAGAALDCCTLDKLFEKDSVRRLGQAVAGDLEVFALQNGIAEDCPVEIRKILLMPAAQ